MQKTPTFFGFVCLTVILLKKMLQAFNLNVLVKSFLTRAPSVLLTAFCSVQELKLSSALCHRDRDCSTNTLSVFSDSLMSILTFISGLNGVVSDFLTTP